MNDMVIGGYHIPKGVSLKKSNKIILQKINVFIDSIGVSHNRDWQHGGVRDRLGLLPPGEVSEEPAAVPDALQQSAPLRLPALRLRGENVSRPPLCWSRDPGAARQSEFNACNSVEKRR